MYFFFFLESDEKVLNVARYCFSACTGIIMWFLSFILLTWCHHTDLLLLNYPYIPGISPTWSLWTFQCAIELSLLIFCWEFFISMLIRTISLDSLLAFFLVFFFCLALLSRWCWPNKRSLEMFSFLFSRRVWRIGTNFS